MGTQEIRTFCRVCEAVCGVIASDEDGRITRICSDPDHVLARGHFCKKAMGAVDVTYDPDRVLRPLKRTGGPGEFSPISWDQAFAEISEKLGALRRRGQRLRSQPAHRRSKQESRMARKALAAPTARIYAT